MARRHNFQTVSWFYDLKNRTLLDLDPPYQRRSVWNQEFKDYFIDTVLSNLPAPALFLYEDISPEGRSVYHVVDGKQRLTALFEFVEDNYPVSDRAIVGSAKGKYFSALSDEVKKEFWSYQFLVEYVPSDDERMINEIFDRINRNVSKLTSQELRHAKLDGQFIGSAELLAEWNETQLPKNFPRFANQSRKQMKDVEFVALLLLLIKNGPQGYSQEELDAAFIERDVSWDKRVDVENEYREVIGIIKSIINYVPAQRDLSTSRLRNQADFYSLFGAVKELCEASVLPEIPDMSNRLIRFVDRVDEEGIRISDKELAEYYDAARSASNVKGAREKRIKYLKRVLLEEL